MHANKIGNTTTIAENESMLTKQCASGSKPK